MGIFQFVRETAAETRHVAWPSRRQVVAYTALVLAISALVAVYLGALDHGFTATLRRLVLGE